MISKPRKLMVVEDDSAIRSILGELLTSEGYEVCVAEHGKDALDILNQCDVLPSLILLDLSMPVMDGRAFLMAFEKANASFREVPVVIMTAAGNCELPKNISVKKVLKKPLDVNHLMDTIERTIYVC